ncbi:hypothetical protein [Halorubrum sp. SD683]|uniref:hypothetical protein n=1 Tax=Halorubrum sp. SD683 TaxID=1855873 RepID=UPI000A2DD5EF|nr:hypothetical protein [Halorubrum sp. SD683]OTE99117.1 hypothetical protein B9G49_13420 [Halorubrum sp. SD683]
MAEHSQQTLDGKIVEPSTDRGGAYSGYAEVLIEADGEKYSFERVARWCVRAREEGVLGRTGP